MRAKLYVIYLVYGREHLESGLKVLDRLTPRLFPGVPRSVVVVDNAWSSEAEWLQRPDYLLLPGDNSNREFSGWDVGYRKIVSAFGPNEQDIVLLANDTFHRNYGSAYLDDFSRRELSTALRDEKLVGYMDSFPHEVSLFGLPVRSWIRTSLVIGRTKTLDRLYPFSPPLDDQAIFSGDVGTFFCEPSALSSNYRQFLKTWLFGQKGDSEFDENWHSSDRLSDQNIRAFEGKTRAILSEQLLSARARAFGIELFDTRRMFCRSLKRLFDGLARY